jgi:hypothetical protein
MVGTALPILVTASTAAFALSGKYALDMRRDCRYRTSWGAWFWALFPTLVSAFVLTTDEGGDVTVRNAVLGVLGGVVGAFSAVWLGYFISDWRANAQPRAAETVPTMSNGDRAVAQDNRRGNFSEGQQGGTNNQTYIEQRLRQRHIEHEIISSLA